MYQRINLDSKPRHRSGSRKINLYAIIVLFIFSILYSSGPLNASGLINKPEHSEGSCGLVQNDCSFVTESYTTTRRGAIVDYVRALQAPEGYFHAYLEAPPPFEPDGTEATFTPVLNAYGILNNIDRVDELDWSTTNEFLLSLVGNGLLNLSKRSGPTGYTCRTALTLFPSLGIESVIDVEASAEFVASLQTGSGGFLTLPRHTIPTLPDTYYALDTLRIVGRLDLINLAAARSFVVGCYKDDGGFSNTLGGESNFNFAPAGIYLMEILGMQDVLDLNKTTDYLLQFWDNESGCDIQGDLLFTYRIAWSLWLLNREDSIDTAKLLQWVLSLQRHAHGEFVGYPEADLDNERLVSVFYVTHILTMYNGTNLLDSDFLVDEKPVWTIPQWWIDYINSEWSTISNNGNGGLFRFVFPDLSFMIALIPYMLIAVAVITPALWITARSRNRQIERRERKRKRKNRQSNG
jgi:prenyltransferase beta subunit